jgi:peptide/nickel transport system substrate-binding protein
MMFIRGRRARSVAVGLTVGFALTVSGGGVSNALSSAGGATPAGGYGAIPAASGTPVMGGTVNFAEQPGAGPTWIFPVIPGANASVNLEYQFINFMYRPLWWGPKGVVPTVDYSQSMAPYPKFSNDDKTITIHLTGNWKWSDGRPVTSADVAFGIDETEAAVKISAANFSNYTPGMYPDFITHIATPDAKTVVLTLDKSLNQNFDFFDELGLVYPLPAHAWAKTSANGPIVDFTKPATAQAIYRFLAAQAKSLSTYGSNPLWQVVDGPYKIKSFDPSTDANTLVANPNYGGPVKPHVTTINEVAFTSTTAEFNQLLTGNLTVGLVDPSDLAQVGRLKSAGYNVFGYPDFGFSAVFYNFKDKTGGFDNIISQLYIRQALAHLQDEPAEIQSKGLFDGAAGQAYGPVPAIPQSPFAPADALTNPYPFSISAASKLLSAHGWKVVSGGVTKCVTPGTGPSDCGAGIAAGAPLSWNLVYATDTPLISGLDEALASNAKQVGITITLSGKTFNYILANFADPTAPKNDNLWAMEDFGGFTNDLYPTTSELFNTTGQYNEGGYSDKTADTDINNSVKSLNPDAVKTEIDYLTKQQPAMFQPNNDLIWAWKKNLSGPPASFASMTQYQPSPEYWYFTK